MPPLSSSPSSLNGRTNGNALTRALSIATGILRGSKRRPSSYQNEFTPSSPRRIQTFGGARGQGLGLELQGARDAEEDELLTTLEELAQKTEVLTHWADEMYNYVKAFPQSEFPTLCLVIVAAPPPILRVRIGLRILILTDD